MVTITSNLPIAENETLRVYSPEGDYADTDLILCADVRDVATPVAMLQAQFIKYGGIVYQFNTPEEIGKAIFAVDPNSKHDAVALYREEEARNTARNAGTLEPENPAPTPDSPAVETTAATETNATSSPAVETSPTTAPFVPAEPVPIPEAPPLPPANADSMAEILAPFPETGSGVALPPDLNVSTTTPTSNIATTSAISVSTTTPAIDISTTTPE